MRLTLPTAKVVGFPDSHSKIVRIVGFGEFFYLHVNPMPVSSAHAAKGNQDVAIVWCKRISLPREWEIGSNIRQTACCNGSLRHFLHGLVDIKRLVRYNYLKTS